MSALSVGIPSRQRLRVQPGAGQNTVGDGDGDGGVCGGGGGNIDLCIRTLVLVFDLLLMPAMDRRHGPFLGILFQLIVAHQRVVIYSVFTLLCPYD